MGRSNSVTLPELESIQQDIEQKFVFLPECLYGENEGLFAVSVRMIVLQWSDLGEKDAGENCSIVHEGSDIHTAIFISIHSVRLTVPRIWFPHHNMNIQSATLHITYGLDLNDFSPDWRDFSQANLCVFFQKFSLKKKKRKKV